MEEPEVTELAPTKAHPGPRWQVLLRGEPVGWIRRHRIGKASRWFYAASALAPDGSVVELESSTVFETRVTVIVDFALDPERYRGVHWHPKRS
jgi:hypothetical protein